MSSIWNAVSKYLPFGGRRFIGKDLAGNKYYEYPNPTGELAYKSVSREAHGAGGRARRVIKYRFMSHMADYTSGKHRLPIQWTAWLAYTRSQPPSMAELQQDAARQSNLVGRIADIETRERDERIRQGYITEGEQLDVHSSLPYGSPASRRIRSGPSFSPPASAISYPQTPTPQRIDQPAASAAQEASGEQHQHRYPVPTPSSPSVPPPPETVDPAQHSTKDDLRRLAEEDTKRRIAEQGGEVETRNTGVQGVATASGGGLKPRRRGGR